MPSAKKGKKKGSQVPAADPLSSPAPPRRNDDGLPFDERAPQPSPSPSGVHSPAGSKGPQDLKLKKSQKEVLHPSLLRRRVIYTEVISRLLIFSYANMRMLVTVLLDNKAVIALNFYWNAGA